MSDYQASAQSFPAGQRQAHQGLVIETILDEVLGWWLPTEVEIGVLGEELLASEVREHAVRECDRAGHPVAGGSSRKACLPWLKACVGSAADYEVALVDGHGPREEVRMLT